MKHIAFDLGAESGRAIVGEISDGRLAMEEIHRFPTQGTYVNGSMRWDIYRLFAEIKKGLAAYAEKYGDETCTMGVDTWGVDYGFLDRNGKLCAIPYHYRDERNVGTAKIIEEKLGLDRLYELTGIQQMELNTLNQLIAAKRDDDSIFDVGQRLLFLGDILHYFLCGSVKAEYSIATTSNMYSTITDEWQAEVLETFDLDPGVMPEVVGAGSVMGAIREDLAEEFGLSKDCQVIAPPVHDTASAATAAPAETDTVAFISSGTWSLVGLELAQAVANDEAKKNNIANYGSSFGKKLFIRNVMGLWLVQQARKQWLKTQPDLGYGEIVQLAEKAEPFYGFIDPNDDVFLNPANMPYEICAYLKRTGQRALEEDNVGQVARIIFECLAFRYRMMFEMLTDTTGKTLEQINIIGGGIQNKMLTQFTADATGVRVAAGPIEATAAGNLLMQAYGTGEVKSHEELRSVVRNSFEMEYYAPMDTEQWEQAYQAFKKTCGL